MRPRASGSKSLRAVLAVFAAGVVLAACTATPSAPSAPAAPAATPRYSVAATPLEVLEGDVAARAAVVRQFPKIFEHPAYAMFKSMTLAALLPYSDGALTEDRLQALQADLDTLH